MKGLTAFEAIGNLSDHFIMDAVLPEDVAAVAVPKRPSAFIRFINSGWGVAAVCALVAVSVMGGIIWAGNRSDPGPAVTPPAGTHESSETVGSPETDPWGTNPEEVTTILPPVPEGTVRLRQYTWDGWGITNKALDDPAAARLIEKLSTLRPTGEYIEPLSSETMAADYDISVPEVIERGTYWIEVGDQIYRLSADLDAIWLVDGHYGGGQRLSADDAFFDLVYSFWRYHPYDSYVVTYKGGEFTMNHAYEAESPIRVEIVALEPDLVTDGINASDEAQHKITLRITALNEDMQTGVRLHAQYSDDHLLLGDGADLSLKAGIPQTVTLTYPGRLSWGFEVNIAVENVRIYLYHRAI